MWWLANENKGLGSGGQASGFRVQVLGFRA